MRRNGWWMLLAGVVGGILGVILGRGWEAVPAWGQHLARFQNVEVDFETTGTVSTLVFFDRDSGALYFYAATANGPFQFARSVRLQELGGPLQATSAATPSAPTTLQVPQLPSGLETATPEVPTAPQIELPVTASKPLDLNAATLEELQALPGIGPVLARRILEYRTQHGAFRSVEELLQVSGIGTAKLREIRPYVTVK